MKKYELVLVEWLDASAQPALEDHTEDTVDLVRPVELLDVGWVIDSKPKHIVLAGEADIQTESFRHTRTIPKVNIQKVDLLLSGSRTHKYDFKRRKPRTRVSKRSKH